MQPRGRSSVGARLNMANVLYDSTMTPKAVISAKSADKKAVHTALADAAKMLEAAFSAIVKADDKRARNVANAAKGRYQTAVGIVAACYPYQTAEGVLLRKAEAEDGRKYWAEKAVTAVAARGLLRISLDNFIKGNGQPAVAVYEIGAEVEAVAKKAAK